MDYICNYLLHTGVIPKQSVGRLAHMGVMRPDGIRRMELDSDVVTYGQIFSRDPSSYDPHVRNSRVYFDPTSG